MAVKREAHTPAELKAVLEELNKQTDRGAAIIGASIVEELLAVVIQRRLRPLNSELRQSLFERPNAPLSSFSAKINLGLALGLFSTSAAKHLHILRECRNRFAHRVEALNFDHADITDVLKGLNVDPAYKAVEKNRDRFFLVIRTIAMIFVAECAAGEKVRIADLGETHPDIFVGLLAKLFPEKASALEAILKAMKDAPK